MLRRDYFRKSCEFKNIHVSTLLTSVVLPPSSLWFQIVEVAPGGALLQEIKPTGIFPGYRLECYPNRDSTVYGKLYDIESANTIVRGSLRYEVGLTCWESFRRFTLDLQTTRLWFGRSPQDCMECVVMMVTTAAKFCSE